MTKMMLKFGIAPNLPIGQGALPVSLQGGMSMMNQSLGQNPMGSIMQLGTKGPEDTRQGLPGYENIGSGSTYESFASKGTPTDSSFSSRTEKVISSFLQNPVLKGEDTELNNLVSTKWNLSSFTVECKPFFPFHRHCNLLGYSFILLI